MITLGIDLASDPKKTGMCTVAWSEGQAVVEKLRVGADDYQIVSAVEEADVVGIDAPFGWPVAFEELLAGSSPRWTGPWSAATRDVLRFRATDFRVRALTGHWPLSVSSDLIAVPALRCVRLLERIGVTDRSGDGRVYETYPAAALHVWGLQARGYKGPKRKDEREKLWAVLTEQAPWLQVDEAAAVELLVERDDALDALIAALIARAATRGETVLPASGERDHAATEGWIHVPVAGSLTRLV
jgi:predicted nuclease with RNAse H fold